MICATCRHWDKAVYPKNPKFGQCTVPLAAMPIWALRQISPSYRAIDMATKDCEAYASNRGAVVERYNCPPMSDQKPEPDGCMVYASDYDAIMREREDYMLKQKVWEGANDELRSAHIRDTQRIRELEAVVRFCRDIAEEEWPFQQNNSGAECALRHIISRTNRAVSSGVKGSAPSALTAANRKGEHGN